MTEATSPEPTSPEPTSPEPSPEVAPEVAPEPTPEVPAAEPPSAPAQWPAGEASDATGVAVPPPPGQVAAEGTGIRTSSNAIIALVLSIASWVVCPIVPAIVALVFASMARKEIEASNGRVQGDGMVLASRIVAWINIGLTAAVIVIGAFVLVLVAIAGGMHRNG